MLGDYRMALRCIQHVDIHAEVPLFYKIPACHITLYYYMGFAYLMMRRYFDATTTFANILVFMSKTSGVNSLSYQLDFMMKKQDQMYNLLLICQSLCPQPLDESLERHIQTKLVEKQAALARGEMSAYEDVFIQSCPKFVDAAVPDFEAACDTFNMKEASTRQLNYFLLEVKQQQALPKIGAYMKLYTTLKTNKLANLCEMDDEGLRDQLLSLMHKTQQRVHVTGAPLEGKIQACGEVQFYLDADAVHIDSYKPIRPHAQVFLEQIDKFSDVLKKAGVQSPEV